MRRMVPLKNELEDWKITTIIIHLKSIISITYGVCEPQSSMMLTLKN